MWPDPRSPVQPPDHAPMQRTPRLRRAPSVHHPARRPQFQPKRSRSCPISTVAPRLITLFQASFSQGPPIPSTTKILLMPTPPSLISACPCWASATACRYPCFSLSGDPLTSHRSQEIAWNMGGTVSKCDRREYGFAHIEVNKVGGELAPDALFKGLGNSMQVRHWTLSASHMSLTLLFWIRSGCPMAINFPHYQTISTLSDIPILLLMLLSLIIPSRSMASSSIQRSPILLEEERS
jgi:hypothetical protein